MSERRTLRTRGEVIEEYSRDFPAEIVKTYSRPPPGAIPEKAAVSAAKPRKKCRVLKGLLILLAIAAAIVLPAASLRQPPRQTGQTCPSSAKSKCRKKRPPLRKQPLLHLRRNKSKYQRRNRRATTAPPFLYFAGRYIIIGINNILGFVKTENVGSDPHIGPW